MIINKEDIIFKGWQRYVFQEINNKHLNIVAPKNINKKIENIKETTILLTKPSRYTLLKKYNKLYMKDGFHKNDNFDKDFGLVVNNKINNIYMNNINCSTSNQLICTPLGVYPKFINIIDKYISKNNTKSILLYANFNYKVGKLRRKLTEIIPKMNFSYFHDDIYRCHKIKRSHDYSINKYSQNIIEEYYDCISKSKFVICVSGHKPDTFRLWETLYLGAIPVVEDIPFFRKFKHDIPILLVKDFEKLTKDYLEQKYEEFMHKQYPKNSLKLSYWKNKIKKGLEKIENE